MENPCILKNSSASMNFMCDVLRNLSLRSNNNLEGEENKAASFSLPTDPNPVSPSDNNVPTRPTQNTDLATSRPPGFRHPNSPFTRGVSSHTTRESRGNDNGNVYNVVPRNYGEGAGIRVYNSNPYFPLLRSLGLFAIMTCKDGIEEFKEVLKISGEEQIRLIGARVTSDPGQFLKLSSNPYGSSAMRRLLKKSNHVDGLIFSAVLDVFFPLMTSKYGHYVAVQTLSAVDSEKKSALYQAAEAHAIDLACHGVGCASLNEFLTDARGPYRNSILNLIACNALWLSQDPYGNFVVQNVLSLQNPFYTEKIASLLYGNYVHLSSQKVGSYVVEKCLNSTGMSYVMEEFLRSSELVRLARNEFGNYVMQSALKVTRKCSLQLYQRFVEKLRPHFGVLQNGYGRNIVNLVEKLSENKLENGTCDFPC